MVYNAELCGKDEKMKMLTMPIKGLWVICRAVDDYSQEFGAGQFEDANNYLNEIRRELPDLEFEMIAEIDA